MALILRNSHPPRATGDVATSRSPHTPGLFREIFNFHVLQFDTNRRPPPRSAPRARILRLAKLVETIVQQEEHIFDPYS